MPERLIGYVAHNLTLGTSASKTVRLKNLTDKSLRNLIADNLSALLLILKWNAEHGIRLYRMTSNLIPFATHDACAIAWWEEFGERFKTIGAFINEHGLIVSMHPGQYTVLSSADTAVVKRSIADIEYHALVLDLLGQGPQAKIIIHLGGGYGDKTSAIRRWMENWSGLKRSTMERIAIENDERVYGISDCLQVSHELGIPVVFDALHYRLNAEEGMSRRTALEYSLDTWPAGITPEVHYSDQQPGGRPGSHSRTVDVANFKRFWNETAGLEFNVMLETKDKELSVLKLYRELGIG